MPAGRRTNIVLVGMPGAGKSTTGVVLARALRMSFVDTDLLVQERTGRLLQEILDTDGPGRFRAAEEGAVLSLACENTVIATGGSVVYSDRAMRHLKAGGTVVYLRIPFDEMKRRLFNITTRGVVLLHGETLREMYDERVPLYEQYADITADCGTGDFEECIALLAEELETARTERG